MNKKLLSILISLLFIFIILSLIYVYYYKNNNKLENFIQNKKNKLVKNNENRQNLISNGSFTNGKNISSFFHSQGFNEIIVYPNSGNTSYVLRQSNNNNLDETYYCIKLKLKTNSTFYLSCLLYSNKNNKLIHKIKFKNNNNQSQNIIYKIKKMKIIILDNLINIIHIFKHLLIMMKKQLKHLYIYHIIIKK